MTLFNAPDPVVPETPVDANPLETLVGEGKKFKDVSALAHGKLEADRFVLQLQNEGKAQRDRIKQLEEELNTRTNMQDFLDEIKSQRPQEQGNQPPPSTSVSTPFNPADIDELLDKKLEATRRREIAQQNVDHVQQELTKTWGPDYVSKLVARARELGLSQDFLGSVAETSPKAFLEMVIPKTQVRPEPTSIPRSGLNVGIDLSNTGVRNQSYYNKMKQTDPALFRSEKMTVQRHRDAQRLGEAFFS